MYVRYVCPRTFILGHFDMVYFVKTFLSFFFLLTPAFIPQGSFTLIYDRRDFALFIGFLRSNINKIPSRNLTGCREKSKDFQFGFFCGYIIMHECFSSFFSLRVMDPLSPTTNAKVCVENTIFWVLRSSKYTRLGVKIA